MKHIFQGDPLRVPADRPKLVQGHVRIDDVPGHVVDAHLLMDSAHSDPSDLLVTLKPPDGDEIPIVSRPTLPGALFQPFRIPASALTNPEGHWTLKVADLVAGDGGVVDWRIELTTASSQFFVELELAEAVRRTAAYRAAFEEAALRWAEVITGALTPATLPNGRRVDNLLIFADAKDIDGPGRVLGQAGPTHIRDKSLLPIAGIMEFDLADLASMADTGLLLPVILHEMGHVLGVGTLWNIMGLINGAGTSDPEFKGEKANVEFAKLDKGEEVPIENTGGPGTREGHWRESVLDNELMTGWIDAGFNPLSRITVASLSDMGYEVDMDAADRFGMLRALSDMPKTFRRCGCTRFEPIRVAG